MAFGADSTDEYNGFMSRIDAYQYPAMRPVELRPSPAHRGAFDLTDPSGIAASTMTVSSATLSIIARMDGRHDRPGIQAEFLRRTGRMLFSDELDRLIVQLDEALFLRGPTFDDKLTALQNEYRLAPHRPIRDVRSLGAPIEKLGAYLDSILDGQPRGNGIDESRSVVRIRNSGEPIVGLVAPHLDYERGAPCYGAAYRNLAERTDAARFIILGTNHFGRSRSVVGTRKDFGTPFGVVPCDEAFMRRIDERLGVDLCDEEYDHLREHSIELQVVLLKHLLGDRPFKIASYLCPDPCGPAGTAPPDGGGVDLTDFAAALRDEIEADGAATCLIAGADLSHVGRYFQDERDLSVDNLHAVEASDQKALALLEKRDAEGFRCEISARENDTNICSVGCIYALTTALDGRAQPRLLHYHQAVTPEHENCVTCAAMEFTKT